LLSLVVAVVEVHMVVVMTLALVVAVELLWPQVL